MALSAIGLAMQRFLIVSVPDHCLSFYFESGNPVSYTDHTQLTIYYIWL